MLGRIKWESIDEFRPPKGCRKHVPKSEYAALDRAIAQKENNALLRLKRQAIKPLTQRQIEARNHLMYVDVEFPRVPASISNGKSSNRSQSASALESLPLELQLKIFVHVSIDDRICVALTSTKMLQAARLADEAATDSDCALPATVVYFHLMDRLRAWTPSHLEYCCHCQTYLPAFSFGPTHSEIDRLICMDCRFYSPHLFRPGQGRMIICQGCLVAEKAVDAFLEGHDDMVQDEVWNLINGGAVQD